MSQPPSRTVPMTASLMTRLLLALSVLVFAGLLGLTIVQSNLTSGYARASAAQTFEDKTVLLAAQMLGRAAAQDDTSAERAYAPLIGEGKDLSAVRVLSADGKVLDSYAAASGELRRLEEAMRGTADSGPVSTRQDGRFVTIVPVLDPTRGTLLGHVGMVWSGERAAAAFAEIRTQALLLGLAVTLGIVAVMVLLLRGMALKPISSLQRTMTRLADGQTDIVVPHARRSDEIGQMAKTVEVFRDNAVRVERLHAEKIASERQAADEREAARAADEKRRLDEERRARAEEDRRRAAEQSDRAREQADADAKAKEAEAQALVVDRLAKGLKAVAAGDLSFRIKDHFIPAYEHLRKDFNEALQGLETSMATVIDSARMIEDSVGEIQQGANELSKRTESQAATIEETAAALDEVTTAVSQTAAGAQTADRTASRASDVASSSNGVVKDAVAAMSRIETSSREVSKILNVIDEIAFQTNLLALNAGVEAARAGDAGRGFAVVASEVRALAQRSSEAAKEIKTLIGGSTKEVEAGVQLVNKAGTSIDEILVSVTEVSELVAAISASASEQSRGLSEINLAVNRMDTVTQQNAAMVEQSTATSHALGQKARELMGNISRFKTSAVSAAPRPAKPTAPRQAASPAPASPKTDPAKPAAPKAEAPKPAAEQPAAPKPAAGKPPAPAAPKPATPVAATAPKKPSPPPAVKEQQARVSAFAEGNLAVAENDDDWDEF